MVLSLAFILAFIGAGVALLIGIILFSEVEASLTQTFGSTIIGGGSSTPYSQITDDSQVNFASSANDGFWSTQRITFPTPEQITQITVRITFQTEADNGTVVGGIWKDATIGGTTQTIVATSIETYNLADLDNGDDITFTFPSYTAENIEYVIGAFFLFDGSSNVGLRTSSTDQSALGVMSIMGGGQNWVNLPPSDLFGTFISQDPSSTVSNTPDAFSQASNIAFTVIGILPVALFFFLFAIFGGRTE